MTFWPVAVCELQNGARGMCNTYVPTTNVYERLLWVTQVFVSQGFYVSNCRTFVRRRPCSHMAVACLGARKPWRTSPDQGSLASYRLFWTTSQWARRSMLMTSANSYQPGRSSGKCWRAPPTSAVTWQAASSSTR